MGSPEDEMGRDSDEGPARKVRFDKPFYMGAYEVTQEQYEKVTGMNPSKYKGPKFPVQKISWKDARDFCRSLSSLVGEQFRLPTEAEWEYACRAGTTTMYYWGNRFDDQYAWTLDNSKGVLHEVGTRLPNAWGLFDMSGNVWEWCEDLYVDHIPSPDELLDMKDVSDGADRDRILRGGSWNVKPLFSRSANRSRNMPTSRMEYNGFRIVLDLK
jgi:formylglycine-generating enzyme required for sulfatase activity